MDNPLLDEWRLAFPGADPEKPWHTYAFAKGAASTFERRWDACTRWAFSVPTSQAITTIVQHAPRIVELGAGTGYWAKLLHAAGADIVCYDKVMPGQTNFYMDGQRIGTYFPVRPGTTATLRQHADRALLLSWPPYESPIASWALDYWRGEVLIYVGEHDGGCCGDEAFFEAIESGFDEVAHVRLPQWYGLNDGLWIYRRKGAMPSRSKRQIELAEA